MATSADEILKTLSDAAKLRAVSDQVLRLLTTPEFLEQMKAVAAAPPERKLQEATQRLTPKALQAIGVDLPANVRISSRYFDDQSGSVIEMADTEAGESIVTAMNEHQPGFLDELRLQKPELFRRVVEPAMARMQSSGWCACGGWAGVCVGGGV